MLMYAYHIACTDTGLNMWVFSYTATLKPLYRKKDIRSELEFVSKDATLTRRRRGGLWYQRV